MTTNALEPTRPLAPDELLAIQRRLDATPPGPWKLGAYYTTGYTHGVGEHCEDVVTENGSILAKEITDRPTALFLAASRSDMQALLDHIADQDKTIRVMGMVNLLRDEDPEEFREHVYRLKVGNSERCKTLEAEVDRLRSGLSTTDVRVALAEGHAERRAAEGDNAWTTILRQRDAALTEVARLTAELASLKTSRVAADAESGAVTAEEFAETMFQASLPDDDPRKRD